MQAARRRAGEAEETVLQDELAVQWRMMRKLKLTDGSKLTPKGKVCTCIVGLGQHMYNVRPT